MRKICTVLALLAAMIVAPAAASTKSTCSSLLDLFTAGLIVALELDCEGVDSEICTALASVSAQREDGAPQITASEILNRCDRDGDPASCVVTPILRDLLSDLRKAREATTAAAKAESEGFCFDCEDCQDSSCCCTYADCDCIWVFYCGSTVKLVCSPYNHWTCGWQNDINGACRVHCTYCDSPWD